MKTPTAHPAHVLVACDFSDASNEAIRQADAWARREGAKLSAVHVVPDVVGANPMFPQTASRDAATQIELEKEAIDALTARITELTGRRSEDVHVRARTGAPDASIVREAESVGAELIVVGATGHTGLTRLFLGSTAERVARLAHCSVLVARQSPAGGHVLAGTDLSDPALPAVHAAAAEAKRRGARLHVLHAMEVGVPAWTTSVGLPFGASSVPVPDDAMASMQRLAEESLRALTEGLDADILVAPGNPASAISKTAETLPAELVVVASHGRTGLARIALGSVADKVIRAAHCSVLVVRR